MNSRRRKYYYYQNLVSDTTPKEKEIELEKKDIKEIEEIKTSSKKEDKKPKENKGEELFPTSKPKAKSK